MPSNILTTDTSFPQLTEEQSNDEKFGVITNYLYMLLEQLRYSMANLGRENFNDAEFNSIANTITEPVFIRIEDVEGNVSSLQVTAQQLSARMEDAEGNISSLQVTAQSLTSRISDAEGNISTLQQTSNSFRTQISDLQGNVSVLQQTSQSFNTRITDAEGDISELTQTVNGFTLEVSNGATSSVIRLLSGSAEISSQTIRMDGLVTFTGLQDGTTAINGACIMTGSVLASVSLTSPAITGGSINGARYYNISGSAYLEVGGSNYGDMSLWGSGNNRVFQVYDQIGNTDLRCYDNTFLSSGALGTYPQGTWDFSSADVSGITATFA